jgi:hypothetical protein
LALAWWARGSTAAKRSLFNSGVGRNKWLSIQIFDLIDAIQPPVPDSGTGVKKFDFDFCQIFCVFWLRLLDAVLMNTMFIV